jgi:hypothetical protein
MSQTETIDWEIFSRQEVLPRHAAGEHTRAAAWTPAVYPPSPACPALVEREGRPMAAPASPGPPR